MARMVALTSGRSVLNWFLVGFPLLGAVLPYAVGVAVYATVGGGSGERPDLDPMMAVLGVCNAVPFVAVTLLGRGQLSTGAGHWISSLALILVGGAVALVWPLFARSWWAFLPLLGVLAVGFAAWSADVAVRRAGIIGSGVGVLGLSVQSNAELWRTLCICRDSPRGPPGSSSTPSACCSRACWSDTSAVSSRMAWSGWRRPRRGPGTYPERGWADHLKLPPGALVSMDNRETPADLVAKLS